MQLIKFKKVDLSETGLMEQIHRLRFQVYGRECGFINECDYPDGLEKDEYDEQAMHFAAINSFGEVIGSVRMILPGKHAYPIEKNCPQINSVQESLPGTIRFAEISRLVISKQLQRRLPYRLSATSFSCRQKVGAVNANSFSLEAKPVVWGLCQEAYRECKRLEITHFYALMEKGLWALLRMYGFKFRCIGDEVDLYGSVYPYVSEIADIDKMYN